MSLVRIQSPRPTFRGAGVVIAIPVRYRRTEKARFLQTLQHAVPSVIVLGEGINHLTHDPHGASLALGIAEVGVATLVIGSVLRGFRRLRAQLTRGEQHHAHRGIDWIDVCLGAMLAVEAYAKYDATGRIARPMIVLSLAMFALGFLHARMAAWGDRRRELRITEEASACPAPSFAARRCRGPTWTPSP